MTKKMPVAAENSNKAKLIELLINSAKTQFTSADADWLNEQSETILEKLIPVNKAAKKQYTRIDSVCDALKEEPTTVKDWSELAAKKYVERGGQLKPKSSLEVVKMVAKVVSHFPIQYTIPK
jgi:hypothetical protein